MAQNERGGWQAEYARSGRSSCKACKRAIGQDELRVGKEDKSEFHDGWDLSWYHPSCAKPGGIAYKNYTKVEEIKNHELLRWDDQLRLREFTKEKVSDANAKQQKKDNDLVWETRDALVDGKVSTKILEAVCNANGTFFNKKSPGVILGKAADILCFGRISPCPNCKDERLYYNSREYVCKGWLSAYTKCGWRGTDGVVRFKAVLPDDAAKHKFFKSWSFPAHHATTPYSKKAARAAAGGKREGASSDDDSSSSDDDDVAAAGGGGGAAGAAAAAAAVDDDDVDKSDDTLSEGKELWGMTVAFAGSAKALGGKSAKVLGDQVKAHGGEVATTAAKATVVVTSTGEAQKAKPQKKVADAMAASVPLLTPEWLDVLCERQTKDALKYRKRSEAKRFNARGADVELPAVRLSATRYSKAGAAVEVAKKEAEEAKKRKREEKEKKRQKVEASKKKTKQPVKGSDVLRVDPGSEKSAVGEVLVTYDDEWGYTPYHIMLNYTDIATGENKYYRAQVIKNKNAVNKYWFYISYGRVGVDDIGDSWIYDCGSQASAIKRFTDKFKDKTGNVWSERHRFKKKPGKYFLVDLDDGNEPDGSDEDSFVRERQRKRQKSGDGDQPAAVAAAAGAAKAALPAEVRNLVNLIFDKKLMQTQMKALNIDTKKMPLGKISKRQLSQGYRVLSEIETLINAEDGADKAKLIDATNRFYTLIPHDFGTRQPPLIDTGEMVNEKQKMIEALVDMEIATTLGSDADADGDDGDEATRLYEQLKCGLMPLDKSSEEYKLCVEYAHNQREHHQYTVVNVFKVERRGEADRFKPAADSLGNRHLLWHGSRLTNYVGILSQGLRIAPPEAPKSGYRLGKGVYAADVLGKSFGYCRSYGSEHALVMLLDVALGKPAELKRDQYMEKPLPKTNCTKALGAVAPDPKHDTSTVDGVRVPKGPPTNTGVQSSFRHNEYVLYDVKQCKIHYLLQLKCKAL